MFKILRPGKRSKTIKALLILIGAYTLLLLMDYSTNHQHTNTICLFKIITGIPCSGCGMGRATLALIRGDLSGSFSYNILGIPFNICIAISIFWLIVDLVKRRDTFFKTINQPVKYYYLIPFFILTVISWIINIIRGI